jgi:hypothetical protein
LFTHIFFAQVFFQGVVIFFRELAATKLKQHSQIQVCKFEDTPLELGQREIRPLEFGPIEIRPLEFSKPEVGPLEFGKPEVGPPGAWPP